MVEGGKIFSHDTAFNEQLNLAVTQLERLQRGRRGEPVPAPIGIEVMAELPNEANNAPVFNGG